MKTSEIKKRIIGSLENEHNDKKAVASLQEALAWDFSEGFEERVLAKLRIERSEVRYEYEFNHNLNLVFYRVAFTAAAAIIFLMLSVFLKEGSLSFDSLLGMSDGYSESIVCMLTGN
ncbi:MAG: hypothetical protein HZB98_03075 [Bacteroidia bacterium]|nr:hypothetical protein [Bacteroidia bacterium]